MAKIPVDYMQTDSKWASFPYSVKGEKATIKTSGCGTTCAAMVIASLKDKTVTPVTTAKWSLEHGYKAYKQGTYYSYFVPQFKAYNISCRQINTSNDYHKITDADQRAYAAVKSGKWVICCMGPGRWTKSGHYILWYGFNKNGSALIMDPNSTASNRRTASVNILENEAKYFWEIDTEETLTQEEFNKLADAWMEARGTYPAADWSKPARDWGYSENIMIGGAYKKPATREELIQVLYQYSKLDKK